MSEINLTALHKLRNSSIGFKKRTNSIGDYLWTPPEGTSTVRILPYVHQKDMPFVRGRSEGFGSKVGPDYGDYINAEKAAAGRLKKMDKITPKGPDVIGLAKKVKPGTIKKASPKIPVPAKKSRLRRK